MFYERHNSGDGRRKKRSHSTGNRRPISVLQWRPATLFAWRAHGRRASRTRASYAPHCVARGGIRFLARFPRPTVSLPGSPPPPRPGAAYNSCSPVSGKPFERRLPPRYRPRHWAASGHGSRPIGRAPSLPARARGGPASIPPHHRAGGPRKQKHRRRSVTKSRPVRPCVCVRACVSVVSVRAFRYGRGEDRREQRMRNSKLTIIIETDGDENPSYRSAAAHTAYCKNGFSYPFFFFFCISLSPLGS